MKSILVTKNEFEEIRDSGLRQISRPGNFDGAARFSGCDRPEAYILKGKNNPVPAPKPYKCNELLRIRTSTGLTKFGIQILDIFPVDVSADGSSKPKWMWSISFKRVVVATENKQEYVLYEITKSGEGFVKKYYIKIKPEELSYEFLEDLCELTNDNENRYSCNCNMRAQVIDMLPDGAKLFDPGKKPFDIKVVLKEYRAKLTKAEYDNKLLMGLISNHGSKKLKSLAVKAVCEG